MATASKRTVRTVQGPLVLDASTQSVSIPAASASQDGYLDSADFTAFNNKVGAVASPLVLDAPTKTVSIPKADATQPGYLSAADFTTFNNKLDSSRFNYIANPDAEVDTSDWNLYDDAGRAVAASYVEQDITWSAVETGNGGNGINIQYIFHGSQSSSSPLVTVVSPTLITVAWYNGPTLANNPTATELKAAFDAVPGAVALVTCTITGTASDRQYITGSHVLKNGGDTAPVDGAGSAPTDLTFTRSTVPPILVGNANFVLAKGASSQLGSGVSTDFTIDGADKGNPLQVSFYYSASSGAALGSASDIRAFLYDVTNATMIALSTSVLRGPTADAIYRFAAQFTASVSSVNYRLILHTATVNASAWTLKLGRVTVNSVLDAEAATQVPKIVLESQPILVTVTDRMAVMWQDGNTAWRPATMASATDSTTKWGFATNIVGLTADIVTYGYLDGFSVGPFLGYNQYVSNAAGEISPLPSPFTDTGIAMGKGVAADAIFVDPRPFTRLVTSKGGLLTNGGLNNGTGDQVLAVGTNGTVPVANSAASLGIQWLAPIVAAAPFTFTAATRTLTIATATNSVAGVMSAADRTTFSGYATSKANVASPTFTGDVNSSTGDVLISTIGKGLKVKTGTNSKIGTATLVAGTVTVANTSVTANSKIFLSRATAGGTLGHLSYSKTAGTSFTITSNSATDTSTVDWMIVESIP